MGESFLLGMYLTLGRDGSVAALTSLYREAVSRGSRVSEDEIYREFLRHTPQGREERFRAMYRCLHGRPIPGDAESDRTECDPIALAADLNPEEEWTAASARWVFESGDTTLHRAMFGGQGQVVQRLLDEGGDVNAKTEIRHRLFGDPISDVTPLHLAAQYNGPDVTALLLDRGADINVRGPTDWGYAPLLLAAQYNREPFVAALLLDRGADPGATDNGRGAGPLHHAAFRNGPEVVSLFLERGVDINVKDERGNTALHNATIGDRQIQVRELLEQGADTEARNNDGLTPLHLAAGFRSLSDPLDGSFYKGVVSLLPDRGADLNAEDNNGITPCERARRMGKMTGEPLLERLCSP